MNDIFEQIYWTTYLKIEYIKKVSEFSNRTE